MWIRVLHYAFLFGHHESDDDTRVLYIMCSHLDVIGYKITLFVQLLATLSCSIVNRQLHWVIWAGWGTVDEEFEVCVLLWVFVCGEDTLFLLRWCGLSCMEKQVTWKERKRFFSFFFCSRSGVHKDWGYRHFWMNILPPLFLLLSPLSFANFLFLFRHFWSRDSTRPWPSRPTTFSLTIL